MFVETSSNQIFLVRAAGPGLDHVWLGVEHKRVKGGYAPKSKAREILVRKAGCRVIVA